MESVKEVGLKYINIKVAHKLHKMLCKKLEKADHRKVFDYDIDAHSNFCAEVVQIMDVMIGQVARRTKSTK
jgi:hypothetical protein